jgi:trehalose 6-phosphate synthase/phosphatase
MKRQIDELVGEINGKYGTLEWTPVTYQYRSLPFSSLAALYNISDIALVTPLRDGMNLIAKEYLATRTDNTGVLILSEMAGASRELGEAIIINPNSVQEIADAISTALDMPREEQIRRNTVMRERLSQYSVNHWAKEFLTELSTIKQDQYGYEMQLLSAEKQTELLHAFKNAHRALLLLDYDGTLVPFSDFADLATPSSVVTDIISKLSVDSRIDLCIISGRDRQTLQRWFGNLSVGLVAEHGVWRKEPNEEWLFSQHARNDWKVKVLPILTMFVNRLPHSYIEDKEFSLAWHYRSSDQGLAELRAAELVDSLVHMTANIDVQILHGNKVIEIRNAGINKGLAAMHWVNQNDYDFIMAIGDDWTDEDMFSTLPQKAFTIRVGMVRSHARFNLHSHKEVITLLSSMLNTSEMKERKENAC